MEAEILKPRRAETHRSSREKEQLLPPDARSQPQAQCGREQAFFLNTGTYQKMQRCEFSIDHAYLATLLMIS